MGVVLLTTSMGFSQNNSNNWKLVYLTDDFGDKTGQCLIANIDYYEGNFEYLITVGFDKENEMPILILNNNNWKKEIEDGLEVTLSFKSLDNSVNSFYGFIHNTKGDKPTLLINVDNNCSLMIDLLKKYTELKVAIRIDGYEPSVFKLDCTGFTRAYNEMLNCKP